jgi:multicomponent Na+:H+ antiporter subunit B
MSVSSRTRLFLVAGACFLGLFLWGLSGLPAFGHYRGPYGDVIDRVAIPERHVTDAVAAVNFDYRGVDTIGEEFILFVSAAAVTLLLRVESEEEEKPPEDESLEEWAPAGSDAVQMLGFALIPPIVVLGLYVVAHGHLTPGGGFQGGVILASAPLLIYLAGRYRTLRAVTPTPLAEIAEATGAGAFVAIGVAGMIAGTAFLQNVIPLGPVGELYSSGMIPVINLAVGLEVAAAFLLLLTEFLKQSLQIRWRKGR